jgi:hemerythrin
MKLEWQPNYSVGVGLVDTQHQKWIDIINRLDDAVNSKKGKEEFIHILADLAGYTDYHFTTEEKYFVEFDYPDAEAHKKIHDAFRQKLDVFLKELQDDEKQLPQKMLEFTKSWLIDHILKVDKDYTKCFNEHGLN